MPTLEYISEGGYQYRQSARSGSRLIRVAREPTAAAVTANPPKIGDTVRVIIKPYVNKTYVTGKIKRLLTRKNMHTRGFKVMLDTGIVGRMVEN